MQMFSDRERITLVGCHGKHRGTGPKRRRLPRLAALPLAGGGNQELEDELDTLDAFVALGGERDRSGSSGLWNQ